MTKKLSIVCGVIISLLTMLSCDNDISSEAEVTFNGAKIGDILYTVCEISYPGELDLEAHFVSEEGNVSFDMTAFDINSLSELKKGMDITDLLEINQFYPGIVAARQYYEIVGGTAIIESCSSKAIKVKFSNFQFTREIGNLEDEIIVNGSISYTIYN